LPNQEKLETVAELQQDVQSSNSLLMTDYRGLTVSEITQLRRKLRDAGSDYKVAKNTLLTIAVGDGAPAGLDQLLAGPTAVAFVKTDAVAAAKAIVDFAKDHKAMSVKGGLVEGRILGPEQITALSKVPPKEVLIAMMLGSMQAPITGLVGTLSGCLSNLVFTLQAVVDQKAA
jgi:large subunit ribosomal protein L10